MDTDTLTALGQSTELPDPDPPEQDPPEETPEQLIARGVIPEGYTRDPYTKEIRPKKRGGRRRQGTPPPAPDTPIERGQDEPPNSKAKGRVRQSVPRWQKGVIAAGMTKLYKRTGKIIKAMDRDIGIAVIESAEDCGEAWDDLARTNPRVRAFLMKLIAGGAWGAVLMAHAPILMAIIMKDGIRKHIPFIKLLEGVMSDDEDGPSDISTMLGGMTQDDIQRVMDLGMQMMGKAAMRVNTNGEVTPDGTE